MAKSIVSKASFRRRSLLSTAVSDAPATEKYINNASHFDKCTTLTDTTTTLVCTCSILQTGQYVLLIRKTDSCCLLGNLHSEKKSALTLSNTNSGAVPTHSYSRALLILAPGIWTIENERRMQEENVGVSEQTKDPSKAGV